MRIDVVTIFPAYVDALRLSLVGKAIDAGVIDLHTTDLRDFAVDRHRTVDDAPYGGGPGMVMTPTVWGDALDAIADSEPDLSPRLVIPTPSGRPFTHETATDFAVDPWLVFACGRYEGIDARVSEHYRSRPDWRGVEEVSIGDYVLAGGEVATLVMVEALARLIPGVLGNPLSARADSFVDGLLEGPRFTRPATWRGLTIPDVLLSGDHARIAAQEQAWAQAKTEQNRPDLRSEVGPEGQ